MNKKEKFENFLESLKGTAQDNLIESVKTGFQACYEAEEKTETCPTCEGKEMHKYREGEEMEWDICRTCDGAGKVTPTHYKYLRNNY